MLINETVQAEFTSVWDGGVCITTKCMVNTSTHEVSEIETATGFGIEDSVNVLDGEYVSISGSMYPVKRKEDLGPGESERCYWYDA